MQHLDPDRLVLLALSEEQQEIDEIDHLMQCAGCRHDLDSLREVADLGVEGSELRDLPAPPARIWHAIEADLGRTQEKVVVSRPRFRWRAPLLAAAAAAVLAVAGTVAIDTFVERRTAETVMARATLAPLPEVPADASGSVRVLADGQMRVDVRNLPLTSGFHEVWLLDPDDLTKMVAIGSVSAGTDVALPVPPGTDLNRFRLVDVSDEPHDGDVTHSGNSLLRGTLTS